MQETIFEYIRSEMWFTVSHSSYAGILAFSITDRQEAKVTADERFINAFQLDNNPNAVE